MGRLIRGGLCIAFLALPFSMGSVAAQQSCPPQYPSASQSLTVSSNQVSPGDTVTVSGEGFQPGTTVTIILEKQGGGYTRNLRDFTVGADGKFSGDVTIPNDAPQGDYSIKAQGTGCDSQARVIAANVEVRGTRFQAAPPKTGVNAAPWVAAALGAFVVGGSLIAITRRRRRSAP